MAIYELDGTMPKLPPRWWGAPDAQIIGDVKLDDEVGVWFGAVLRGDNEPIIIGARTNVQEHAMIHTDPGYPVTIGSGVTIGHRAIVHGCTIDDDTLIGMGAIILNGSKIGKNCLVAAGALVTEGKEVPDGSLVVGSPGKVVREVDAAAKEMLRVSASSYVRNWERFSSGLKRIA